MGLLVSSCFIPVTITGQAASPSDPGVYLEADAIAIPWLKTMVDVGCIHCMPLYPLVI
jgi:hypothetical protein